MSVRFLTEPPTTRRHCTARPFRNHYRTIDRCCYLYAPNDDGDGRRQALLAGQLPPLSTSAGWLDNGEAVNIYPAGRLSRNRANKFVHQSSQSIHPLIHWSTTTDRHHFSRLRPRLSWWWWRIKIAFLDPSSRYSTDNWEYLLKLNKISVKWISATTGKERGFWLLRLGSRGMIMMSVGGWPTTLKLAETRNILPLLTIIFSSLLQTPDLAFKCKRYKFPRFFFFRTTI